MLTLAKLNAFRLRIKLSETGSAFFINLMYKQIQALKNQTVLNNLFSCLFIELFKFYVIEVR